MNKSFLLFAAVVLCFCLIAGSVWSAVYYVDNSCANNGNGSTTTCGGAGGNGPFSSLANAQGKAGGYSGDDQILLNCGTYRSSFLLPSSGTSGHNITLGSYCASGKPVISGADMFSSWSVYSGTTYQAAATTQVEFLWVNDVQATKGSSQNALNNGEWFWASNVLYYRSDSGSPGGTIEGATRQSLINNNSKGYWNITGLKFDKGRTGAISLTNYDGFNISDIETNNIAGVSANGTTNVTISRSKFGYQPYTGNGQVYFQGAATGSVNYCTVLDSPTYSIHTGGTANLTINNTLVGRSKIGHLLHHNSTGTLTVNNSIFLGTAWGTGNPTVRNSSTGTLTLNNSVVTPNGIGMTAHIAGTVTQNNVSYQVPKSFRRWAKKGFAAFMIDDLGYASVVAEILSLASVYGYKFGHAVGCQDMINFPSTKAIVQSNINTGLGWVTNHTYTHSDISVLTGMTVQYVGAGSAATMTIASSTLTTDVTDASGDNLNIDLTNASYDTLTELCTSIDGLAAYTCSGTNSTNYNTHSASLADISGQDIRTAALPIALDAGRHYAAEIGACKTWIQNSSNLTAYGGGALTDDVFSLPFGSVNPDAAITYEISLGYKSARTTTAIGSHLWRTGDPMDPYYLPGGVGASFGAVLYTFVSNNANDTSGLSNSLTTSNVTYDNTMSYRKHANTYVAVFNGTSSYATRAADTDFAWSKGDGIITMIVRPSALNVEQTLYFQSTDDSNYHRLYITNTGALSYAIVSGGSTVLALTTGTGVLSTTESKRISLIFFNGRYSIYIGDAATWTDTAAATTTSTVVPGAYTGAIYVGCSYLSGSRSAYYGGHMQTLQAWSGTYYRALAHFDTVVDNGGLVVTYSHSEGISVPVYKAIFEAARDHGTIDLTKSWSEAITYLRSNGTLDATGRYLTWRQTDASDYRPRHTSPLIYGGSDASLTKDLDDLPVRNSSAPTIGPYEAWPKIF